MLIVALAVLGVELASTDFNSIAFAVSSVTLTSSAGDLPCDGEGARALQRVREAAQATTGAAAVCIVCLEEIAVADAVWACKRACHVLLHLVCAQGWARQQLAAAALRADAAHGPLPGCDTLQATLPGAQAITWHTLARSWIL